MIERELNFEGNRPLLYLVATPIGNLSEFTSRAIEILKETDYVAAEDTRHSGELLARFGINKPFISCHEHNEEEAGEKIVNLLLSGKKVAYMSDAGYPVISDPGERLAKKCIERGIKVSTLSGPNAALNALTSSGLDSRHFYFEGFLPSKRSERKKELQSLKKREETIIFYESPHRIMDTLEDMFEALGDRKAVIARELTKSHEEFIRGTLGEFVTLDPETLRGEMVIVIEGGSVEEEKLSDEKILSLIEGKIKEGKRAKEAVAEVAKENGVPKNAVYSLYLANKD